MDVLTTAQANATFGAGAVRARIASGKWQRPTRGVVVTHNGPIGPEQRLAVVVASAPPGSALAGLTALAIDGLAGFTSESIFLAVPNGARLPREAGMVVHQSIHLRADDVRTIRGPRRTTPARSLIDAASWGPSDRFARAVVIAALQQGLTSTRLIREALVRRPTQLRRGLVVESVLDAAGGVQSLPERDFEEVRIGAGLPAPTRQRPVRGAEGRYFLDVWFESERLGVEIHGIPHLAVRKWDADLVRANEIIIKGHRTLTFSSYAIRREKATVVDQLRRALAA